MNAALNASIRASGCASSAATNCGRKARKKIDSFGLRMLIRIAVTMTRRDDRASAAGRVSIASAPRSAMRITITAILINILNPKLSIFFLAFLPQFVSADEAQPLTQMLMLSAVFMLMTFVVFAIYGLFAASVRDRVITRPRVMAWLRRSFAAGFAALGARLAFSDR